MSLPAPQPVRTSRRSIFGAIFGAGAFAALGAPVARRQPALRDSDANRCPITPRSGPRLPLPFLPGAGVEGSLPRRFRPRSARRYITMHLAEYVHGDGRADADQFHDVALLTRRAASRTTSSTGWATAFGRCSPTSTGRTAIIPRWALDGGLAA